MDQWYFAAQGQQPRGPVSLDDLRRLVAAGQVRPTDVVWRMGAPSWLPVAQVPELAAPPNAAPMYPQQPAAAPPRPGAMAPSAAPHPSGAAPQPAPSGGFLSALHSLPKPVLFGLYGGLGALFAALILGELCYAFLPAAKPLKVRPSEEVKLYPGGENKLPVEITRRNFTGDVWCSVASPPKGIIVEPVMIRHDESAEAKDGKGATLIKLDVKADDTAAIGAHDLQVTTKGKNADGSELVITEPVRLEIVKRPPALVLAVPTDLSTYGGGGNKISVEIKRYDFGEGGDVKLELASPPTGVHATPVTIPADMSRADFEIRADDMGDADKVVNVSVRAIGLIKGSPEATKTLALKVLPAPPSLGLGASSMVQVYAGEKNKFAVKIARHRFKGRVSITPLDLPPHAHIDPIVLAEDQTEADMEVKLGFDIGAPRDFRIRLEAKSVEALGLAPTYSPLLVKALRSPATLNLAISSPVEVYQGGKCKFTVRLARGGFDGPVKLRFDDLPTGIRIADHVVPAGRNEMEVDGSALPAAKMGTSNLKCVATGPDGTTTAAAQFVLDVKFTDPSKLSPPLDIVFLLDTTGSMEFAITGVKNGIERFARDLEDKGLEARVGLVAFRDLVEDPAADAMKILKFKGEVFTKDYAAFRTEVSRLRADGGGDLPESSYDATIVGAKLPFRDQVQRILIMITDAEPKSLKDLLEDEKKVKSKIPATLAEAQKAIKANKIDQYHVVCRNMHRKDYEPLQKGIAGAFFDIDKVTGGGEAFAAELLPSLSKEIARVSVAAGPAAPSKPAAPPVPKTETPPPLARAEAAPPPTSKDLPPLETAKTPPLEEPTGRRGEEPTIRSLGSDVEIDRRDWFTVVLIHGLWTAVMAAGVGLLLVGGQKLYLQRTLPTFGETMKVLLAGLGAGLLGGALSQSLFLLTSGGTAMDFLTRIPAWTIFGGLLGAGIGFFVPNLKWHRGLIGGCIGGFIGALGFVAFNAMAGSLLGRWIGALLVGFCIGLMIALAELAFRRYWLEVTFGAREVRTVTLGASQVAVGGDERLSAVFVPGAAPRALGYHLQGDRIVVQDFVGGKMMEVQPGHQVTLGSVKLAVRSANPAVAAAGGAMTLRLSNGKTLQLMDGMPLTAQDLPGLQPQGTDGIVALVSPRPSNRAVLLLRNRSKQGWKVRDAKGIRDVGPGLSVELTSSFDIAFGGVQGRFTAAETIA